MRAKIEKYPVSLSFFDYFHMLMLLIHLPSMRIKGKDVFFSRNVVSNAVIDFCFQLNSDNINYCYIKSLE